MATAKPFPCLWFDRGAEEAAVFYTSLLPDSRIDTVWRSPGRYAQWAGRPAWSSPWTSR
jgi:predicted 3-demethylubiquinone-9 3-methyltransferase (glyoxalase superfamily)